MLQNAYFVAKIGADTAENEQHSAEILPAVVSPGQPIEIAQVLGGSARSRRLQTLAEDGAQETCRGERPRRPSGAACAKEGQYTDRLQNPAKLRRFWIWGGIRGGIRAG